MSSVQVFGRRSRRGRTSPHLRARAARRFGVGIGVTARRVWQRLVSLGRSLDHRSSAQANNLDVEKFKNEQSKTLAATSVLFSILGVSSIGLILVDFRARVGAMGFGFGLAIVLLYAGWMRCSRIWFRRREHDQYMRSSIIILGALGVLWGALINCLSLIATPSQHVIINMIIMALISTPMLGAPFTAAIAFWAPTVAATLIAICLKLQPFNQDMILCFLGYVLFTLGGIIIINRSLLERSVNRIHLQQKDKTIGIFLRDQEEDAADWVWETDAGLRLCRVSQRLKKLFEQGHTVIEGTSIEVLLALSATICDTNVELAAAFASRAAFRDLTVQTVLNGRICWLCLTGHPVLDERMRFRGYHGVGSDVTTARLSEQRIRYLASHDTLTGLCNRQMFLESLTEVCGPAASSRSHAEKAALLILDLDRFKEVNDSYGHATGDALLRAVSDRLLAVVSTDGLVARLGGDEFAILLRGAALPEALSIVTVLLRELSNSFYLHDTQVTVGVSIGVAIHPTDGATPKDLMRCGDLALYSAKGHGRGTYKLFDRRMTEEHDRRLVLQTDLLTAIDTSQLFVEYQPIVNLQTGVVVSVEALLRWRHPTKGFIPPSLFIPIAEEAGLISRIGEFVMLEACRTATFWAESIRVAVNISPVQFGAPDFLEKVQHALESSRLRNERLELEITESMWIAGDQQTLQQLARLDELNIRTVLDDFGTGYSSLSALRKFQFHGLKIDANFVRDLGRDDKAVAIIKLIAKLAYEIGVPLTAEGVETSEQVALLRTFGIEQAQGYLFSRPLSRGEAIKAFGSEIQAAAERQVLLDPCEVP